MAFLLFLHIHNRKCNKNLSNPRKTPDFPAKKDEKRGFCAILGRAFRPVAQNFSQKQESPIFLPFMALNGIFLPKKPPFFAKNGLFLCKLPKKAVILSTKSAIGVGRFCRSCRGCLLTPNRRIFVQNYQKPPPLSWLTAPICRGIIGEVPNLPQFPHHGENPVGTSPHKWSGSS